MQRNDALSEIKQTKKWDFIIIGGGASGLWCAVDAALRGYHTLLIERGDFASVTSSKSTKLIHGGLRYLKHGHISLVKEALYERGLLEKNAPGFVQTKPFFVPYYNLWDKCLYSLGMFTYDFLAGSLCLEKHHRLSRQECLERLPHLKEEGLKGGCIYYDGQFDDARFAIELAKKGSSLGASLVNYMEIDSFIKSNNRLVGLKASDLLTGESYEIFGRHIINATGIFSDEIRLLDNPSTPRLMSLSRGTHIIVDQKFIGSETAIVVPKTPDGRLIFMIPWLKHTLIGTTDIPVSEPLEDARASSNEIDYLLELASQYLKTPPKKEDVLSLFSGIRPLVKASSDKKTLSLSRTHRVMVSASGLITLAGGKWTTSRRMAQDTIDKALKIANITSSPCQTKELKFSAPTIKKAELIHPSLQITWEDVERGVRDEMAQNLSDMLARRSRSLFLNREASLEIASKVAKRMGELLDKNQPWVDQEAINFSKFSENFLSH